MDRLRCYSLMHTWIPSRLENIPLSMEVKRLHSMMVLCCGWLTRNVSFLPPMHMRGVRTRLGGTDWDDYDSDTKQGFSHIESDEIIDIGLSGIVNQSTSS